MKDLTVLLLYASYGNGHKQAALALEKEFYKQGAKKVILSDLYIESYPKIASFTRSLYEKSFKPYGLPIYKAFYYGTDKYSKNGLAYLSQFLGLKRIKEIIEQEKPNCIITTYPFLSAPMLRNTDRYSIPTYTVITDYCLHSFWVHPYIQSYFVSSEKVGHQLKELGVKDKRIIVSGIPIRSAFDLELDTDQILQTYQLDPKRKIITVVAGAVGQLRNVDKICQEILKNKNIQLIVICGNNERLYQKLLPLKEQYQNQLKLFGYVENIHDIFQISYCIITKPGGISITEAAAKKVPLIFYKPTPGQEKENADFFQKSGGAFIANDMAEIHYFVSMLIHDEKKHQAMKEAISRIYKPYAARNIVSKVIQSLPVYS